jgi:hypothetical protein
MATEDILIRYRADVSQLEADINKLVEAQEDLTKATADNTKAQQKSLTSAEFAAKKRAQLLEQEEQKLIKLKEAQKLAFDPVQIQKYNQQISESQRRIEILGNKYQETSRTLSISNEQILGGLNRIAGAFGIAFSVEALINFAKQSVQAFADAEKSVTDLRNTITLVAGESVEAFDILNSQAEKLGNTTIFSSDQVRQAQSLLSNFGLTSAQIEELIPKLAGFAKATNQDIVQAAQKVGSALNGSAKEFNNLGANINSTNTAIENYNEVLRISGQYTNQAALDLTKINDQLIKQQKLSDDVSQFVGSKLASAWQNVILVINGATAALLGYDIERKKVEAQSANDAQNSTKSFIERAKQIGLSEDEILKKLKDRAKVLKDNFEQSEKTANREITNEEEINSIKLRRAQTEKRNAELESVRFKALLDATKTEINSIEETIKLKEETLTIDQIRATSTIELNKYVKENQNVNRISIQSNIKLINEELEARKKANETAVADAQKALEQFKNLINSIDAEIAKLQADLAKRKIEIIPAETQQEQIDRIKALADLNEQAITDEIAGKVKLVQEDANLSDKQKADVIAKYEELKQARLALANFNEQNELNIINQQQVDRIVAAFAQIDALNLEQALVIEADKVEAANEAVAKSFEDLGEAISKADFEAAKQAVTARTEALNQALTEENNINKTRIENARDAENAKVQAGEAGDAERKAIKVKYDNQIENADKELNKKIAENNKQLNDTIEAETQRATDARIQQTFEILSATQSVLNEINSLFKASSDQRISEIEAERDAQLENIDAQLAKNEEYLEKRRISEEEAAANEKSLIEEKAKIEAATQKKIRDEKRKQAILDKAAALFDIALNTAIAVSKVIAQTGVASPALIPLIIAQAALQSAAVIAQPIPYRKGSKDTGAKGHLARVGEEGEELVFMPSNSKVLPARQTRKYADIIDAMYDNKLDDYVYKNYITPALMAQKEAKDNQLSKSFAENMANSIVYNQTGLTPSDLEAQRKRGQYIRNVDEIAEAIAKKLPIRDIYRA